jgi:hypothetical protein
VSFTDLQARVGFPAYNTESDRYRG